MSKPLQIHSLDFMWLELTLKCNLECVHCYSSSSMLMKDDLTTEDWANILEQGAEVGCRAVQFIGGEPTLFKDLLFLVEKSRELGYNFIEVYTNATLLTDVHLDELRAYNVSIATSFYSYLAATHDSITQRKGSFDRTVRAIRMIVEKGMPLRVGIITLPQNQGQSEDIIKFLVNLGVPREQIGVDRVRGEGRGTKHVREKDGYSKLCGSCWRGNLAISSDGSVYPCIFARQFNMGNVLKEPLNQILKNQELINFRHKVHDLSQETKKTNETAPLIEARA